MEPKLALGEHGKFHPDPGPNSGWTLALLGGNAIFCTIMILYTKLSILSFQQTSFLKDHIIVI